MYHFVCLTKYCRIVIEEDVDKTIKETCQGIEIRYDMRFTEIDTDMDHVHFLIQAALELSTTEIIRVAKSITAKRIFKECPKVKKKLWDVNF